MRINKYEIFSILSILPKMRTNYYQGFYMRLKFKSFDYSSFMLVLFPCFYNIKNSLLHHRNLPLGNYWLYNVFET